MAIMERNGVTVEQSAQSITTSPGVWPDMREHGWERDEWPAIDGKVRPLTSSCSARRSGSGEVVRLHEGDRAAVRHNSGAERARQYAYYGQVGGCLITGNEDGIKHCSMNILYSLQHLGYTIPPQAEQAGSGRRARPVDTSTRARVVHQRLHEPQHDLHDMEPAPPRADAEGRRRRTGARQPALGMGRRLPIRLPESGAPLGARRRALQGGDHRRDPRRAAVAHPQR